MWRKGYVRLLGFTRTTHIIHPIIEPFGLVLGSTTRCFNTVHIETLLLIGPQGSHLSTCYYHQDLHYRRIQTRSLRCLLRIINTLRNCHAAHTYTRLATNTLKYKSIRLSVIHFRAIASPGEYYTLLSGFRLPWPLSCVFRQQTLFMGSD